MAGTERGARGGRPVRRRRRARGGRSARGGRTPGAAGAARWTTDRRWRHDLGTALLCAALLLGLALLVDGVRGSLDLPRAALWLGLAVLLHAALHPVRTGARPGELRTWGLVRRHTVRTDRLVSLTETGGLVPRLLLRDTSGHRLSCETAVLTANPLLWHRLDTDLRTSRRLGLLRTGAEVLDRLEERVDREVLGEEGTRGA
ncbi:translation initiation factor IF-2 [Streptomyces sp. SPB074]|uniref:translation initiation factor IF-2 n=1 Tax=Streptomyces sp. (strain SPB074) TaxID=465543 RepID=UPI00017F27AE|nr:translation initiation factor IF-2 [Streptomyces sp. SPB074]